MAPTSKEEKTDWGGYTKDSSKIPSPFLFLSSGGGYGLGVQVFRVALARRAPALRAQYGGQACEHTALLDRKASETAKWPGLPRCLIAFGLSHF